MYFWIAFALICFQQCVTGTPSTKKCVAHWGDNFNCSDFDVLDNINCWYDWRCNFDYYHQNDTDICTDIIDNYYTNYASMIWGVYPDTNYSCHVGTGSIAVMGANEPNHKGQSDRSPAEVAAIWPQIEANANGKPIISPSAAPCGGGEENCWGNTTAWFDEFFSICNGTCNITYLATHTYWCSTSKVMTFLEDLYIRYGKKIWLTEFACRPSSKNKDKPARVLKFVKEILPLLEAADYIDKYFWYMARIIRDDVWLGSYASLFDGNTTTLTPVGDYYNSFNPS